MPNTNPEYLRLKKMLKENPQYKQMLDAIARAEGTYGKDSYSTKFNGAKIDWRKGKDRTKISFGTKGKTTNAHGRYQFMDKTWDGLVSQLGLTGFSPEEQDIAALKLAEESGALTHLDAGDTKKAMFSLGKKWMGIPINERGDSAASDQKAKPIKAVMAYMGQTSNEKDRAALNDNLKKVNEENGKKYLEAVNYRKNYESTKINYDKQLKAIPVGEGYEKKKKALDKKYEGFVSFRSKEKLEDADKTIRTFEKEINKYWKKVGEIQAQDISPEQKNLKKHEIKKEFHEKGLMSAVNVNIVKKEKEFHIFRNKLVDIIEKNENDKNDEVINAKTGAFNLPNRLLNKKNFDEIVKEGKKFGLNIKPNYKLMKTATGKDRTDPKEINNPSYSEIYNDDAKRILRQIDSTYYIAKPEPGLLKYGMSPEEYNEKYPQEIIPEYDETPEERTVDGTTTDTPEEAKQKEEVNKAEAERLRVLELEKKKANDGSEELKKFNEDDEFVSPQFEYKKPNAKFPIESLVGLGTGLMGMAAADDIHVKYRDEKISEGMILFAQDVAKIKNMGLPPEIEGSLKQKLADAYQTGLNNIVRASNGNRNLVLGNQAQLDQARMKGIVDIAVLDLDRSDKAMAAFGEIQQYINDFESKRDIANNERKYGEDVLERTAAADLAKKGMENFIDAIENAKANGPGSMNDMRRQYFEFVTTGINKGAEPGASGSIEAREEAKAKAKTIKTVRKNSRDWIYSHTAEEQALIGSIIKKEPNLNPLLRYDDPKILDQLISRYEELSGDKAKKDAFLEGKGISQIAKDNAQVTAEVNAGTPAVMSQVYVTPTPQREPIVKKQELYPTIVTSKFLPDKTIMDQIGKGLNGKDNGVFTINPNEILKEENLESIQEEKMSNLITRQNQ